MRLEDRDFMTETLEALHGLADKLRILEPASAAAVEDAIGLLEEAEAHVARLASPSPGAMFSAARWLEAIRGPETLGVARAQIASDCLAAMLGAKSEWGGRDDAMTLSEIARDYADALILQLTREDK